MPDWQERIVRDTKPSIRAEHDLRYAAAVPIMSGAGVWCDMGCGAGVAAAAALGGRFDGHAVLVDVAQEALDEAVATVDSTTVTPVRADLAHADGIAAARAAVLDAGSGGCVTCFEVIEHLASFDGLLELLVELADAHGFTVLLSVPNDAFWAIENPFHQTIWGEGAFEELRRLLPADAVLARQVPLSGSAVVLTDGVGALDVPAVFVEEDRVPSHFLAAFGPRAGELGPRAHVAAADLDGQRRWERQRESDLAFLEAQAAEMDETVGYARELERRLGLRPAESEAADGPSAGPT